MGIFSENSSDSTAGTVWIGYSVVNGVRSGTDSVGVWLNNEDDAQIAYNYVWNMEGVDATCVIIEDSEDVTVQGVVGGNPDLWDCFYGIFAYHSPGTEVWSVDVKWDDADWAQHGITIGSSDDCLVQNCLIEDDEDRTFAAGIVVNFSANTTINYNTIEFSGDNYPIAALWIAGNYSNPSTNFEVYGNVILSNTVGISVKDYSGDARPAYPIGSLSTSRIVCNDIEALTTIFNDPDSAPASNPHRFEVGSYFSFLGTSTTLPNKLRSTCPQNNNSCGHFVLGETSSDNCDYGSDWYIMKNCSLNFGSETCQPINSENRGVCATLDNYDFTVSSAITGTWDSDWQDCVFP